MTQPSLISLSDFKPVSDQRTILGEGLCFDPIADQLYWLDIKRGQIFSSSMDFSKIQQIDTEENLSSIGLAQSHQFICTRQSGFAFLDIKEGVAQFVPISDPESHFPLNRFNDGKVDPFGGYTAGTMKNAEDERTGSWWRLSPEGPTTQLLTDFFVTNGPAFAGPDDKAFVVDSADGKIFSFLASSDEISQYKEHISIDTTTMGHPDGITIDIEGCLWAAFWDGSAIRRFAPDGKLIAEYPVPAQRPTSIEIVHDQIFVTTASIGLNPGQYNQDGRLLTARINRPIGRPSRHRFNDQSWT